MVIIIFPIMTAVRMPSGSRTYKVGKFVIGFTGSRNCNLHGDEDEEWEDGAENSED